MDVATSLELTERVERCPGCDGGRTRAFGSKVHLGVELRYRMCRTCGLAFMSFRPTQETLDRFYRASYREAYCGQISPTAPDLAIQHGRAKHLAGLVSDSASSVASHLDIGCSSGALLLAVRDRFPDVRSVGVEPSDGHRLYAREENLEVHEVLSPELSPPGGFDLISLSHVLEHLPDPVGFLSDLRNSYLASGGAILLEVPNLLGHICYELAHLLCFDRVSLLNTIGRAGFAPVLYKEHSRPRSSTGRQYLTMVARRCEDRRPPIRPRPPALLLWQRRRALSAHPWPLALLAYARDLARSLRTSW